MIQTIYRWLLFACSDQLTEKLINTFSKGYALVDIRLEISNGSKLIEFEGL